MAFWVSLNEIAKIKAEAHNVICIFYIYLRTENSTCVSSYPAEISLGANFFILRFKFSNSKPRLPLSNLNWIQFKC